VIEEASQRPNVRFRLAGKGVEEPACRALAERLGCRNVDFLGHLSQAELGEEMRKADVFFFPSTWEGHPQVLGQASACGLPCVAMDVYRPDYVANGESGFLVASDGELTEKLGALLMRHDLRRSFGMAAAKLSLTFDWDGIAKQWEQLFESAVARRRGIRQGDIH
jgi:glycosyltransferase involved in cell wall biosynthesis